MIFQEVSNTPWRDRTMDDFCGYYKRNEWLNMQAFVAAKLNQLNPLSIVQKLVSKVSLKLHERMVTHIATQVCEFYNTVIDREFCVFSKESGSGYSYMVHRETPVPCISGLSVTTCPADTVYIPIPFSDDFYIVRDIQTCGRLSDYVPRCSVARVQEGLRTFYAVTEKIVDTIVEFTTSLFTFLAGKLLGFHDLFSSMLEHICVHRAKPEPADVPNLCADVLEPAFDYKKMMTGFLQEIGLSLITDSTLWTKLSQKVFKNAGKFIPILDWITITLDEITSDIRKGNCVSAIIANGPTGSVDLSYGRKYEISDFSTVSGLINDIGVIQKTMDKFATAAADKIADVILGGQASSHTPALPK
jgi:hypothetical protein